MSADGGQDRIEHFLSGFDICAENRNFLMHSLTRNAVGSNQLYLELEKSARSQPTRRNLVRLSVEDIRRIADEIDTYDHFGFNLVLWLLARLDGGVLKLGDGPEQRPPLPDKPALPAKLNLSGAPTPEDSPSPRES
jgi:hypothetical protein